MQTTVDAPDTTTGVKSHLAKERQLWNRRDTDPGAREELIRRHLPLARRLAAKYRNRFESFDDLLQVASVGLMNAVNRYEPGRGIPFTAFARPTIEGEIKRYFRDQVWLVRVPRNVQEEIHAVDHASAELSTELRREPTPAEIADRAGVDIEAVERAALAKQERIPTSLDTPSPSAEDEGRTPAETFGDEDPSFSAVEDNDEIRRAVSGLDDSTKLILRLRFIDDMTQSEIADRVGCSQMHISRTLRRTLDRIVPEDTPA